MTFKPVQVTICDLCGARHEQEPSVCLVPDGWLAISGNVERHYNTESLMSKPAPERFTFDVCRKCAGESAESLSSIVKRWFVSRLK
jgi:ribosomal protein L40E